MVQEKSQTEVGSNELSSGAIVTTLHSSGPLGNPGGTGQYQSGPFTTITAPQVSLPPRNPGGTGQYQVGGYFPNMGAPWQYGFPAQGQGQPMVQAPLNPLPYYPQASHIPARQDGIFKVPLVPPLKPGGTGKDRGGGAGSKVGSNIERPVLKLRKERSVSGHRSKPEATRSRSASGSSVSVQSEGLFVPDYDERSHVSRHSHREDINPNDSISSVNHGTRHDSDSDDSSEDKVCIIPEKQDFIRMIRKIAIKKGEEETEESADAMGEMFKDTVKSKKSKVIGLPLSNNQKELLEGILHSEDPLGVNEGSYRTRRSIPYEESDWKKFLRTPTLNDTATDYLGYVRPGKKTAKGKKNRRKPTYKSDLAAEMERKLTGVDHAAKGGIRLAGYQEWLLNTAKRLILCDLPDHPLAQPDSELMRVIDEIFRSAHSQMELFARTSVMSTVGRRELFLWEINWLHDTHEKAMQLPMDSEGEFLFGSYQDKEDNTIGFESIAPDFVQKMTSLREARAALQNPNALDLPKGLPKESSDKPGN